MDFGKVKQVEFFQAGLRSIAAMMVGIAVCGSMSGCIKQASPPAKTGQGSGAASASSTTTPAATSTSDSMAQKPGEAATTGGAASGETATINIEGSSTVYLIAQAWAIEFEKTGNYQVSLGRNGTGGGYKKFALRQCDLWNASRPIAEKEKAELSEKGIGWLELEIATDGLSVAVNPKNTWCNELTVGDLRRLWKPDSTVEKWSDLNSNWPSQKIELFGADVDSGTFEYFTEQVVGKKGSSRKNYSAASDDNVLVKGVAGSEFSLGYIPFGYCVENKERLKLLKISPTIEESQTPEPAVMPTVETILSGEYKPLSRPLYVYASTDALKRPEVVAYLKYAISPVAQPLVSDRGFVRIPEERRKEMEARLEAALSAAK